MNRLKLSALFFLILGGSLHAVTIDFDSAAYAIPGSQLAADANGVDGWESQSFLGFVVPSPGIGTSQALGFGPKYVFQIVHLNPSKEMLILLLLVTRQEYTFLHQELSLLTF